MQAMADRNRLKAKSVVRFEVAERRLALPDTSVEFAWVEGRIDVIGPMRVARLSRYAVGTRVMLLSADPEMAAIWLGIPLIELTDRVVDLRDIRAEHSQWLGARFEAGTVCELVMNDTPAASRVGVATKALVGGARVAQAAAAVNLSERQLTRSFHHIMGLHPKRFQRVVRLRHAVTAAKAGASLVTSALDSGFADQAHFTRETKMLVGASPRAILPNVGNVQDLWPRAG